MERFEVNGAVVGLSFCANELTFAIAAVRHELNQITNRDPVRATKGDPYLLGEAQLALRKSRGRSASIYGDAVPLLDSAVNSMVERGTMTPPAGIAEPIVTRLEPVDFKAQKLITPGVTIDLPNK